MAHGQPQRGLYSRTFLSNESVCMNSLNDGIFEGPFEMQNFSRVNF